MSPDVKLPKLPFPLRDYQKEGVSFLLENNYALLGDDMGLGKTVQVIAGLKSVYEKKGIFRCLIVVPNSLKTNWMNEFQIWFPDAPVTMIQGDLENRSFLLESRNGVVICTYEQMRGTFDANHRIPSFELVVFDEVQRLKNSSSQLYLSAYTVKTEKVLSLIHI